MVSVFYLLDCRPPPLRQRGGGGGGGVVQGYRDCSPAQQVVLLQPGPADKYSVLLEEILLKFGVKHQMKTDLWSGDDCSILFLGISRQAVNCTNLAGIRQVVGDQ